MTAPVRYEEHDRIGEIILDSPPGNSLTLAAFDTLAGVTADAVKRPVTGLIVYGAGRHFSAGAHVDELTEMFARDIEEAKARLEANIDTFQQLEQAGVPVVAAISGSCLGAGLELALACRYRVATARAVLGLPETTFDLMPGCGGTVRLAERVGPSKALEMILSGNPLLGDDARQVGLVDQIVPRKELLGAARRAVLNLSSHCSTRRS